MVAYKNALFSVSGMDWEGQPHKGTVWFDGTSWSERAWNYGDWGIAFTCLALDSETDLFYMVGGYCPTQVNIDNEQQYHIVFKAC